MQATAHADIGAIAAERDAPVPLGDPCGRPASSGSSRSTYLALLTWSFTFFSSARILAYLPTLWALQASGDASQHSLWTWLTWFGSNLTMAAWLYEQSGRRMSRAVLVNLCNAAMCGAIVATIIACRW